MVAEIRVIGIVDIPIIKSGDDLGEIICIAAEKQDTPLLDEDILVVTQKIVSKAEGRVFKLDEIKPSLFARRASKHLRKDPRLLELILRESKSIVRMIDGHLITETRHGWVCANSGVDKSNVSGGDSVALLPLDSDRSALRIRERVKELTNRSVVVIISDTFGRPFRLGHTDVCIDVSGLHPLRDLRGETDIFGYVLRVKQTAVADELASAAELVIGNGKEKIPVAIIRGYKFTYNETAHATDIVMPWEKNLFH